MISRKVGPYVISGTNAPLRRPDAKPTFVMMTDCSPAYYAQMRAEMGPDVLIELRRTEPNDYQPVDDPERRADEWWARNQSWIMAIPTSDKTIIAGYNEKPKHEAAAFCRFELRRIGHLHNSGHHVAVLSASVGCPDLDEWITYAPLRMAMRKGDVWDLHEYASDYADIDNRWHVGRFTLPVVAANLGEWPVVISEFGYDFTPDTNKGKPGWQETTDDEGCLAMLRKLGEFYDTQPRVLGCGAFQQGGVDPKFRSFNMWGIQPRLVAEYAAGAIILPPPVSTPIPPEDTTMIPYYHSSREGYFISDIVIHDTEGPTQAALNWWKDPNNTGRSSAHVLVTAKGEVIRCVPDYLSAHHAGFATIPGRVGINPNRFTLGVELEYPKAPLSPPWPEVQLKAAAGVVREWCTTYAITAAHIWEHKTIDPTRRSDPRNWDRAAFLRRVWPPVVVEPLPNDEQGPPVVLATKARWWEQEQERQWAAGNTDRARAIRMSQIELLARLERELA